MRKLLIEIAAAVGVASAHGEAVEHDATTMNAAELLEPNRSYQVP
ncbi:MAG TPA: hypothetical protein VFV69_04140 [Steroidobacteraceae bacterium]|jgi:hypothetical protein|nr:hypothetical protein [Steroidobacteraceae bacterium]